MASRTFAIGDIHGDKAHLDELLSQLPVLDSSDSVVFIGDYIDRGPQSKQVVDDVRHFAKRTKAHVVALRGNHEDAWLRVIDRGWPEFVLVATNGCQETMASYLGRPLAEPGDLPTPEDLKQLLTGTFFPPDVVLWLRSLPHYYEDEHAIYVHAGLPKGPNGYLHPRDVKDAKGTSALMWCRDKEFVRNYRGKRVVFGHTLTTFLPPELSSYTPDDPADVWMGPNVVGLDTGCGKGGFLTALELPSMKVYESR